MSCSLSPRFSAAARPILGASTRAGFTIVELLVASAITLVVLGLMVQVTFSVLGTFDKVTGSVSARSQATTVLRFLREDFQSIVWRRDNNVWLLATVQDDQTGKGDANITDADWSSMSTSTMAKPGKGTATQFGEEYSSLRFDEKASTGKWIDLKEHRFGQAGIWLRFFTNRSSDGTVPPAPTAVGYQIVRMKPRKDSTEYRYQFFRSVVRSGRKDIANPFSVADAGYNLADNANGRYNKPNTPSALVNDAFGDPGSIRKPDRDALIASNVIDFGVRFWRRVPPAIGAPATTASTLELVFPANQATGRPSETNLGFAVTTLTPGSLVALNGGTGVPFSGLGAAAFSTGFPDFVDIFIRVLTEEGARQIEAYESGNRSAPSPSGAATPTLQERQAYWWQIAEAHSEVYTERIPIVARPF
jgi:hypothetical protein